MYQQTVRKRKRRKHIELHLQTTEAVTQRRKVFKFTVILKFNLLNCIFKTETIMTMPEKQYWKLCLARVQWYRGHSLIKERERVSSVNPSLVIQQAS